MKLTFYITNTVQEIVFTYIMKKDNSSIPLFISHTSIERKQIRITNLNRIKQRNNRNTKVQKKKRQCNTYRKEL